MNFSINKADLRSEVFDDKKDALDFAEKKIKAELKDLHAEVLQGTADASKNTIDVDMSKVVNFLTNLKDKDFNTIKASEAAWTVAIQLSLKKLGYEPGKIDGLYYDKAQPQKESRTRAAVRKFQTDNELTDDGWAGKDTIAKILEKLGASNTPPKKQQEEPKKQQEEPKKQQEEPKKQQEEPKKQQEEPKKQQEEPKKQQEEPKKQQEEPKKQQEEPKKQQEEPKKQQEEPKKQQEEPKKQQEEPKKQQEEPKKQQEEPKKQQEEPKKQQEEPKKQQEEPKKTIDIPKDFQKQIDESKNIKQLEKVLSTNYGKINIPNTIPLSDAKQYVKDYIAQNPTIDKTKEPTSLLNYIAERALDKKNPKLDLSTPEGLAKAIDAAKDFAGLENILKQKYGALGTEAQFEEIKKKPLEDVKMALKAYKNVQGSSEPKSVLDALVGA